MIDHTNASQVTTGHSVQVGPFLVEQQEGVTDCECPESLCRHEGGQRYYLTWVVWDTERDDYAYLTRGGVFADSYERKRDAVAAAKQYVPPPSPDAATTPP